MMSNGLRIEVRYGKNELWPSGAQKARALRGIQEFAEALDLGAVTMDADQEEQEYLLLFTAGDQPEHA